MLLESILLFLVINLLVLDPYAERLIGYLATLNRTEWVILIRFLAVRFLDVSISMRRHTAVNLYTCDVSLRMRRMRSHPVHSSGYPVCVRIRCFLRCPGYIGQAPAVSCNRSRSEFHAAISGREDDVDPGNVRSGYFCRVRADTAATWLESSVP